MAYSAECIDGVFCSQCRYEDCECRCHLEARIYVSEEPPPCLWPCGCGSGRLMHVCCGYE